MGRLVLFVISGVVLVIVLLYAVVQIGSGTSNVANLGNLSADAVRTTTTATATDASAPSAHQLQLKKLAEAYPEHVMVNSQNENVIVWKTDGTHMQFDDGQRKDFETTLSSPDLQEQLAMLYERGAQFTIREGHDPGRVRYEPFFKKMYGSTEAEVRSNLETIYWLPSFGNQPLLVTRINDVHEKLQAVSNELDELIKQPGMDHLLPYLQNPAGTFKWRTIAGTDRLSTHSFGIAIDINSSHSDYWRWSPSGAATYQNQIPLEIVEVFERHGFIWGGKWYHYDTMHFEYRPELTEEY